VSRSFAVLSGVFLVCAVFLAGAPALENGFLNYDDPAVILDNPRLDDPSLLDVFRAFGELRADAWLPLYIVALMPEAAVAGKSPRAFHAASLIWHAACALTVFAGAWALSRRRVTALAAAGFFAVHPVLAESVAWAAGRKDQVSLLLLLASLGAALRHLRAGGRRALLFAPALFAAAMLAKGSVVVQPLLVAALWAFVRGEGTLAPSAKPRTLLVSCGVVGVVLGFVHWWIARSTGAALADPGAGSLDERAWRFLGALGRYAFHLVAPVRLSIHYDLRSRGLGFAELGGLLVLAAAAYATFRLFRRGSRPRAAFAGFCAFAALLPFNGVFPSSSLAMADRYLIATVPACGLLLGLALERLPARFAAATLVLVLGALGVAARARYAEFRDGETVFRAAMAVDSLDPLPPLKAGEAVRLGPPPRPEAAARLFAASYGVARDPVRRARALVLRADALAEAGLFLDAVAEHERLAALFAEHGPLLAAFGLDHDVVRFNDAVANLGAGRLIEARERLARLLADRPQHPEARLLRAGLDRRAAFDVLASSHNSEAIDRARETVHRALAEMREVVAVYEERRKDSAATGAARAAAETAALRARADLARALGSAEWRANSLNDALAEAEALVRDFPRRAEAYLVRAEVLRGADPRHADEDAAAAASVEPKNPAALRAFAQALLRAGRNQDAVRVLLAAKENAPEDAAVARALAEVYVAAGRARLEGRGGRPDPLAARAAAREARAHVRDDPAAWTLEGEAAEAEKDLDGAMACYERAMNADPEFAPAKLAAAKAHQARGLALLMNLRQYGENAADSRAARDEARIRAAADFRAAVRLAPEAEEVAFARGRLQAEDRTQTADPILERARSALGRGAALEAVNLADSALKLDEAYADSWEVLAHAALAAGDAERAYRAFKRAAALDPERLSVLLGLATLHWRRGEEAEAEARAKKFLDVSAAMEPSEFLRERRAEAEKILQGVEAQRRAR
jgi:tetratricopeptide (TPR) repeat protein